MERWDGMGLSSGGGGGMRVCVRVCVSLVSCLFVNAWRSTPGSAVLCVAPYATCLTLLLLSSPPLSSSSFSPLPPLPHQVFAPPQRDLSTWKGGAMLAALPNFSSQWITKAAYDERGPSIVQSACPD